MKAGVEIAIKKKFFSAPTPQLIIEEINRRLAEVDMPQVNVNVVQVIKKNCKCDSYMLYPGLRFLLARNNFLKSWNADSFTCFQLSKGNRYYKKVDKFNPNKSAVFVNENGVVFRYNANFLSRQS